MTISFDLDDTLIPGTKNFDTEKQNFIHILIGLEKIRLGTIELFKELRRNNHRIYIYTTSLRSITKIKWTFHMYGIPVDSVINQQRHNKELKKNSMKISKYPPAFGIDVHIDDSPGLKIEGGRFNFKTLIVAEKDKAWAQTVLNNL